MALEGVQPGTGGRCTFVAILLGRALPGGRQMSWAGCHLEAVRMSWNVMESVGSGPGLIGGLSGQAGVLGRERMSRRCRLCPLGGSCPPDPHPAAPLGSCRSQGGSLCPCIGSSCKGRTRAGRRCSSTSAALHLGSPSRCNLQMKELGLSLRPGREQ